MIARILGTARRKSQTRRWHRIARSQSGDGESRALLALAAAVDAHPSFVEFGFGTFELNCAGLIRAGFRGLLLDCDGATCREMAAILAAGGHDVGVRQHRVTLADLKPITDFVDAQGGRLGVLSIDIDGADFWIAQALLDRVRPEILIVEYNASLGLRPLTVPYDDRFDRFRHSPTGWYHGASITAFHRLLSPGYDLVGNVAGLNLIFLRRDRADPEHSPLAPDRAYREHSQRNAASGSTADRQFEAIADLPFVTVPEPRSGPRSGFPAAPDRHARAGGT